MNTTESGMETGRAEATAKNTRDFCAQYGVKIAAVFVGRMKDEPKKPGERGWEHYRWACVLTCGERTIDTPFSMGLAHCTIKPPLPKDISPNSEYGAVWVKRCTKPTPPTAEDVLDSLVMDGDALEMTFEDWAVNCGYDEDSREAERIYHACKESGRKLRHLLGPALLKTLQEDFERL